jgi:hypothetical protein
MVKTAGGEVEASHRLGEMSLQAKDKICIPRREALRSKTVEIGNAAAADAVTGKELAAALATGETDPRRPICLMQPLECAARGFVVRESDE